MASGSAGADDERAPGLVGDAAVQRARHPGAVDAEERGDRERAEGQGQHRPRHQPPEQGIYLRGYAQKQPKQEYKREAFELFSEMLENLKLDVVTILSRVKVRAQEDVDAVDQQRKAADSAPREFKHEQTKPATQEEQPREQGQPQPARTEKKVGRNEPCPCGSGKKYKHCHGKL